jgi:hypothetical protein
MKGIGMPRLVRHVWTLAAIAGLGLASGCSSLSLTKAIPWPGDAGGKPQQPKSIMALWTDTVLHQPNSPPTRGFAGRLIFYGPDATKPVKVDGTLTVYAFDEEGRDPANARPDRKYVFTSEQLATHYEKTKVGPSYAVWIPFDEASGPKKEVSLIVRFAPKGGMLVVSDQSRQVLLGPPSTAIADRGKPAGSAGRPGASGPQTLQPAGAESGVRPVAYEAPAGAYPGADDPAQGFLDQDTSRTTTIPLPAHFGRGGVANPRPMLGSPQNRTMSAFPGAVPAAAGATGNPAQAPGMPLPQTQELPASPPGWPTAQPLPGMRPAPQPARFGLERYRAPGGRTVPPGRDRALSPLRPEESRYPPASTPPAASSVDSSASPPAGSMWPR